MRNSENSQDKGNPTAAGSLLFQGGEVSRAINPDQLKDFFMKREVIQAPEDARYLSDFIDTLPKDCLFDKGAVGCGGTTIAIKEKANTIIAVPFVALVENKCEQHSELLGVKGGVTEKHIRKYLKRKKGYKKIIVTYDSLPKVLKNINPFEYNIVIDEYHLLFTQYSFRRQAAQTVLNNYKQFRSYCFMTGTVLEEEFLLEEIKGMKLVQVNWPNLERVTVESIKCDSGVSGTVDYAIKEVLSGEKSHNLYFFVNSVKFIKDTVKRLGLTNENTRAIYSKHNKTKVGVKRSGIVSEPKQINFLTSTCFEGADLYDTEGKIVIVSDGTKAHTLTDISTSFQQIAKRIRDSRYKHKISHIYTTTKYNKGLTYEEYKKYVEGNIRDTYDVIEELKFSHPKIRRVMKESLVAEGVITSDVYLAEENNIFSYDPNMVKIDLYNYKLCNFLYKTQYVLEDKYKKAGYEVSKVKSNIKSDIKKVEEVTLNFQETVEKIEEEGTHTEFYEDAVNKYKFLPDAINKLGYEEIRRLKFHQTNIKKRLATILDTHEIKKAYKHLKTNSALSRGSFVTAKKAKSYVEAAYADIGVEKGANIKDYFDVKPVTKTIKGVRTRGYIILGPKVIFGEDNSKDNVIFKAKSIMKNEEKRDLEKKRNELSLKEFELYREELISKRQTQLFNSRS